MADDAGRRVLRLWRQNAGVDGHRLPHNEFIHCGEGIAPSPYSQSWSQMDGAKSKRSHQFLHVLGSFSREENFYFVGRLNNPSTGKPKFASANNLFDNSMDAFCVYSEL